MVDQDISFAPSFSLESETVYPGYIECLLLRGQGKKCMSQRIQRLCAYLIL